MILFSSLPMRHLMSHSRYGKRQSQTSNKVYSPIFHQNNVSVDGKASKRFK